MCDNPYATSTHFLIRSSDRTDYFNENPASFKVNLATALKGSKAQISYAQIPNTYYNVTSKNNRFGVDDDLITIPPGAYSLNDLMSAISNALLPYGTPTVTFNNITNLMTIALNVNFLLSFVMSNNISRLIGFNPNTERSGQQSYTGTRTPKLYDNAIYISTNFCTNIQTTSNLKNVSFVIPHNVNKGEIIQFYSSTQFALQPRVNQQTIGNIEIRVFDEHGDLLQGLGEWCIMIQIL
jgi:hypothetical protein